ncbi:MAG: chorismate synthase [Nitrososphaerales archaeon]
MTGNILGERYTIVSFGESHGKVVGAVVDGCPAGLPLAEEDIQRELDLRKPGTSPVSTTRSEADRVEILSGVFEGHTTGAPICLFTRNVDMNSRPYEKIKNLPRPGHADYVARMKYGGFNDYRGGGRFSARRTISYVMGGAIAKKLLQQTLNTRIVAYTVEIGGVKTDSITFEDAEKHRYGNEVRCPDKEVAEKMRDRILAAKESGDSVGGVIECVAKDLPLGLGEPCFSALDSELAKAMLSIPAAKGVEFGSGFEGARRLGSENNDLYTVKNGQVVTASNNAGGVLGGLSSGMPIVLRVAFKPVSSIAKPQRTVDIESMDEAEVIISGRHDPCVVPRAVPIVESLVAAVLADHALRAQLIPPVLRS